MKTLFSKILLISLLSCSSLFAADGWHLTTFLGSSWSLDSGLHINLAGEDDINTSAEWDGQPFEDTLYYTARLEKWKGNKAQGIEWIHHKIYLRNTTDTLTDFSISDGFNFLLYNWAWRHENSWITRVGAGLIVAHPDVSIDGRSRYYMKGGIGGAYVSGIGTQASLEKWVYDFDKHFISLETKFTVAYVRSPVSTSRTEFAETTNYALHLTLGVGSKPIENPEPTWKDRAQWFGVPFAYYATVYWYEPLFYSEQ